MDIVEFAERVAGLKLLECQKQILRETQKLPRDVKIINTRLGVTAIAPFNNKERENNKHVTRGLRSKLSVIDDHAGYTYNELMDEARKEYSDDITDKKALMYGFPFDRKLFDPAIRIIKKGED